MKYWAKNNKRTPSMKNLLKLFYGDYKINILFCYSFVFNSVAIVRSALQTGLYSDV